MAQKRLFKDLKNIKANPVPGCTVDPCNESQAKWKATMQGPKGTPYEGGTWHLEFVFPQDYPFSPPNVSFKTRIYHPNIHDADDMPGSICVDVLKREWSPQMDVSKILLSLCSLLSEPNPEDPVNGDAARLFKNNRSAYYSKASQFTVQYAMGN